MDADTHTAHRHCGQEPALRSGAANPLSGRQAAVETRDHRDARVRAQLASHTPPTGPESRRPRSAEGSTQLADAMQATRRAYARHLADLCLGDVQPAEDWADWYAGYLLADE